MNTKTLLTVKMEKSLKQAAQETAAEIGIPLGTLVNAILKQFVRTKEVNLDVSYEPTEYLKSVIRESEEEFAKGLSPKAANVDELMKELLS
ncbi:MAG: hypothetical protein WC763_03220 [Candidatus Paceibacterota bacterium]|jgi:addiction module RelB/DinJ family antitoxin